MGVSVHHSRSRSSRGRGDGDIYNPYLGCFACLGCLACFITVPTMYILAATGVCCGSSSDTDIATDFYSPGDSRLLSYSSFFCEDVDMEVNCTDTGASIVLLNSPPTLTNINSFNVSEEQSVLSPGGFRFWQYHLYPNSNISLTVCTTLTNNMTYPINVYLVKGNTNANKWSYWFRLNRSTAEYEVLFRSVISACPTDHATITYNVQEEDEYYLILANPSKSGDITYSAILEYERFEYALPTDSPIVPYSDICSVPSGGGRCSVDIPYGTGSQLALVVTTTPEGVNWGENVDINITCNRRDWAYALVVLIPLVVIGWIVVGTCVYCCNRKRKGNDKGKDTAENVEV